MKLRVVWFFAVLWFAFAGPWWLFLLLLTSYAVRFIGYELLCVALLVDVAFGYAGSTWPIYTVSTMFGLVMLSVLQPRLHWYQQKV